MATQALPSFRYTTRFAYQHVANYDGTSDSICLRCHSTIASSHNEESLERAERIHIVHPGGSARAQLLKS